MTNKMTNINDLFSILGDLDNQLNKAKDEILVKIEDLIHDLYLTLSDLDNQLNNAKDEILAKIDDLENSLNNVTLTPEAETALASLRSTTQLLDDALDV